jgi:hypothetical protein
MRAASGALISTPRPLSRSYAGERGPGGLTRAVERPLPSITPHDNFLPPKPCPRTRFRFSLEPGHTRGRGRLHCTAAWVACV